MTTITEWHRTTAAALAAAICPPAAKSPMRRFRVLIGPRGAARLDFEAMARSSFDAVQQHDALRLEGERIEVEPILSPAEQFHAENDSNALRLQVAAQHRAEWQVRS